MANPAQSKTKDLATGHTVRAYDRDLTRLRGLILEMGERVVEQTQTAVLALTESDSTSAYWVLDREPQIDYLALDADEEVFLLIARRQPTAVDLRIVLALYRIADEVERAGDKAARIAQRSIVLNDQGLRLPEPVIAHIRGLDQQVCCVLERAVGAVAAFDLDTALGVFEDETAVGDASKDLVEELATGEWGVPGEDSQGAAPTRLQLESLFAISHALNRIGNHAAAIAEQVIYVAEGQDVRFRNRDILIETLRHRPTRP